MKTKTFLTLLLVTQIIFISCESGVGDNSTPGRRDYTWKADSLHIPFNVLGKIWGDSPTNVWAVGQGGSSSTAVWRFDGSNWSTDNVMKLISPQGIWGFGNDDVWMCGQEGKVWRYIGRKWQESLCFKKSNWDVGFQEIWGDDPDNVFAVGYADSGSTRHAEMLRWNGLQWNEVQIPNFNTYAFIKIRRTRNGSGDYFLLGWGESSTGGDLLALFEYDGKKMWKIYEDNFVSATWCNLEYLGDELYFLIGNKICKYENGKFNERVKINAPNFNQGFWGRSDKDIFIPMKDGLAHYNGTDIQYLYHCTGTEIVFGAAILDKDVFILEQDYYNNFLTIIKRGTLP